GDLDALAHLRLELIALGRREAAELRLDRALLHRLDDLLALDEARLVAVEIGLALHEILVEALAGPVVALDVLDEGEGAAAEDMRLGEERVLLEPGGAVDAVPRRGEIGQHRRLGPAQMEDDGARIGRV